MRTEHHTHTAPPTRTSPPGGDIEFIASPTVDRAVVTLTPVSPGDETAEERIRRAEITGEVDHVTHPQHLLVRLIGDHVLCCWLAGSPVAAWRTVSLHSDSRGRFHLVCANPDCADGFDGSAVLCDYTEDGDAQTITGDPDELGALANDRGWRKLDRSSWLCEDCAGLHRPASPEVAASLRHVLDGSPA